MKLSDEGVADAGLYIIVFSDLIGGENMLVQTAEKKAVFDGQHTVRAIASAETGDQRRNVRFLNFRICGAVRIGFKHDPQTFRLPAAPPRIRRTIAEMRVDLMGLQMSNETPAPHNIARTLGCVPVNAFPVQIPEMDKVTALDHLPINGDIMREFS